MTINFINTWTDQSINEYGLRVIPVANTAGNALVAFIAWNAANGTNPVSYVADDAHNWWVPLVTSSVSGSVRCSIWIAPNARAARYVSVSMSQWVGGVCSTIGEVTGLPQWAQLDGLAVTSFTNSGTSQSLVLPPSGNGLALAVAVDGNVNQSITPSGSMTALSAVSAIQSTGSGTTVMLPLWQSMTVTNFLTGQNAGFEGGKGNWTGAGNASISVDTAHAHSGTSSLAVTSQAAGNANAASFPAGSITTLGMPCSPGQSIAVSAWLEAGAIPRIVQAGAGFYNSSGTLVSTIYAPGVSDSVTAWTQASGSVTAPATSAFCRLAVQINSTGAAGEVHYVDDAYLNTVVASAPFTVASAAPLACAGVVLTSSPVTPPQPNPNWPGIKVEIGFGYSPGDPTATISWTDVTKRAMQPDGSPIFTSSRGRSYELATPEAGELTVWLDNHDGAFDPVNSASPFWPNVKLQVPIRISGTWAGSQYPIAFGYVSGWPQQWPDPQWGFSPVTAVDAMGVLANVNLNSAYGSEILLDNPYAYFPLGEFYNAANGLPFNNIALGNQRPMIGMDDVQGATTFPLSTGQTLGMLGDAGTGTGQQGTSATHHYAGLQYNDPNFPQVAANGVTLEFWTVLPAVATTITTLNLYGDPPNYGVTSLGPGVAYPVLSLETYVNTAGLPNGGIQYLVSDFTGDLDFHSASSTSLPVADGNPHHHVIVITGNTNCTIQYYYDGVLQDTFTTVSVVSSNIRYLTVGCPPIYGFNGAILGNYDYTIGHVAYYGKALDASRIAKHTSIGIGGSLGDSAQTRFAKTMTWGRAGLPKAGTLTSVTPTMGYADNLAQRSIADALGDITTADQGLIYADAAGNVTYKSRQSGYNQAPKWIFGDWTGDPLNSNWSLTGGITGFSAFGGTSTLTWAQNFTYSGYPSALFTPDGVTAFPGFQSGYTQVSAGTSYTLTAVAYSPSGYSSGYVAQILWYNASFGSTGTSASSAIPVPAGTETSVSFTATAPAGTTQCIFQFFANGTPSSSATAYFALPMIQPTAQAGNAGEIPYLADGSFNFDNTYLYNQAVAQRIISQTQTATIGSAGVDPQVFQSYGASVAVHDNTSETEYLPRNALTVSLETSSDQDVYDWCNWNLAKYREPTFRVTTITIDPASNPSAWPTALLVEQGDIVQVNRRPVGGAVYSILGVVQHAEVSGGPSNYQVKLTISPYNIENNVLQVGVSTHDSVTTNRLAW